MLNDKYPTDRLFLDEVRNFLSITYGAKMNKLSSSLLVGCLMLATPFSTVSASETTAADIEKIATSIELSTQQLTEVGGYIVADVTVKNAGTDAADLKYWISVKGPKGLVFPAKAVVQVNSSEFEADSVESGSALKLRRGIWVRDYMDNGLYTVSIEGVNTETGQIFKETTQFAKGVDLLNAANLDGLTLNTALAFETSVPSDGGYIPLFVEIDNARDFAANVEFWITAEGPAGLNIPVQSRVFLDINAGDSYTKSRGFKFDASYPAGEYNFIAQMYDTATGKRVERSIIVVKE